MMLFDFRRWHWFKGARFIFRDGIILILSFVDWKIWTHKVWLECWQESFLVSKYIYLSSEPDPFSTSHLSCLVTGNGHWELDPAKMADQGAILIRLVLQSKEFSVTQIKYHDKCGTDQLIHRFLIRSLLDDNHLTILVKLDWLKNFKI